LSLLEELMAAGGPGLAAGRVSEDAWRDFVERIVETLDVGPGTSVFDVGCGAGAFLFPLAENGYLVGGIEPSPLLLTRARQAMPEGRWQVGHVEMLDPGEPWDVVVSVSGFSQFKDLDRARGVLARMTAKATHAIAVLDVPDTPPLFDRRWMLEALAEIGVSAIQIEDSRLEGDPLASSRFNVFASV
jgi:cyclopropane fatty-acyl-phospholipid synthase-like methyltransferase